MLILLGWIGAIGSIIANFLVAHKRISGFKIWTIATGILLIVALLNSQWSQVFLFGIYEILNIYAWYKWDKELKNS